MAEKQVIEIEARTAKAQKQLDKLTKDIEKLTASQEETAKSTNKVAKSFSTLTKGAVIGLAIKAIEAFSNVLNSNQRIADGIATVFETVSIVFNDFTNAIFRVYDQLTQTEGAFNALGKVIGGLITLAITPLKLQFLGIKLGLRQAQLAWEESFFGDKDPETIKSLKLSIEETKESLKTTAEEAVKAGKDIAENFGEAIDETKNIGAAVVEEVGKINIKNSIEQAKANVELEKSAERAEVINQGLIEKYDRQAEQLRQIRDEERNTLQERIDANNRLNEVLDEQERVMMANANAILASAQSQYNKNQSQENELQLIQAQNELLAVQAQVEGFRSEQKANDLALSRELKQLEQESSETTIETLRIQREAEIAALDSERERITQTIALEEELHRKRLALIDERLAAEKEGSTAYAEILNERAIAEAEFGAKTVELNNEQRNKNVDIKKQEEAAKTNIIAQGFQAASSLAEEGSALAKGLAVAQVLFDTFKGIQAAFASNAANTGATVLSGGAWPFIQAAAAGTFGAANLAALMRTSPSLKGASAPKPQAPSIAAATSAPSFNIVSAQAQTNLLSDINAATSKPTRAYVVSKDITTAQELDRNKIENAVF